MVAASEALVECWRVACSEDRRRPGWAGAGGEAHVGVLASPGKELGLFYVLRKVSKHALCCVSRWGFKEEQDAFCPLNGPDQ